MRELDTSSQQYYIQETEEFVTANKLVINKNKNKYMIFCKSRKWDFPPELTFKDGTPIEYIGETKLVGLVLTEDLKYTAYICKRAREKLLILRRMLKVKLNISQM